MFCCRQLEIADSRNNILEIIRNEPMVMTKYHTPDSRLRYHISRERWDVISTNTPNGEPLVKNKCECIDLSQQEYRTLVRQTKMEDVV